ncbi:MAG: SGNH/GDSL hydrolase family protein [Nitrospira sp.]
MDDLNGPVQDHIPPALQHSGRLQFKGSILHHSRLFNFLKSLSHLVREKNRSARVGYLHDLEMRRAEFSRRISHLISESASGTTDSYSGMLIEHLQRLRTLVHTAKAELVVMVVPDISQLHHPESQLINRILLKLCRDLSIPFVDMTPAFEKSTDPARYYLWPKDPHTNSEGHEEMAAAVERLICEMPKLRPACDRTEERMAMDQFEAAQGRREVSAGGGR